MFPAGALYISRTFRTPTITPIRIIPPPKAHRMSNPMVHRTINPAIPRPTNSAVPRPTNPTIPRPTNSAVPRPTNSAVARPTNPATPRPTNPGIQRPTNSARYSILIPTYKRVNIPENAPTQAPNIANVKATSHYEGKEFRHQKRKQNAKIHLSIKITNNFNFKNFFKTNLQAHFYNLRNCKFKI